MMQAMVSQELDVAASRLRLRIVLHPVPQAFGPHLRPNFFDVLEAFSLWALFAFRLPSRGNVSIDRPYRVLLFVIDHDLVNRRVFISVVHPVILLVGLRMRFSREVDRIAIPKPWKRYVGH